MTAICMFIFWGAVGGTIAYLGIATIAAAIRSAQISKRLRQKKPKGKNIEITFRAGNGKDWQYYEAVVHNEPDPNALENNEDWLALRTSNESTVQPVTNADSVFAPDDLYALNSEPVIIETEDPPVEGEMGDCERVLADGH